MGSFNSAPLPGGSGGGDSALPAGPSFSDIGSSSLGGLSSGGVKLSGPVGPGAVNAPDDVFRVESVLSDADILDRPPGRSFGDDTFSAIKTAQTRLNDDPRVDVGKTPLKLDGLVNPDGPTQAAIRKLAGDQVAALERLAGPVVIPGGQGHRRHLSRRRPRHRGRVQGRPERPRQIRHTRADREPGTRRPRQRPAGGSILRRLV